MIKRFEGSRLRAGSPKASLENDVLGRDKWVKNLVALIGTYPGGDSLTIALHGKWGSGKTTLLNFTIDALQKPGHNEVIIGRFNPWNFSQQDRLYSAFFATVARLLKRADKSRRARKVATALDALSVATAPAAVANLGFISDSMKTLSELTKQYADSVGDIEKVKTETSTALVKSEKRLVIVIDDVDRLTEREVRQVFQLVKSVADFKNVIYLLAFDHNMVARALDGITGGEGHAFLEKITNVVLRVPPLTRRQVRELFLADLEAYSSRQREYDWDTGRLRSIIDVGIRSLKTMRQMERFANALGATEGLTVADFDFTDHIGLTMLQVLAPQLFDFVSEHPELFVDDFETRLARAKEQDQIDRAAIAGALEDLKAVAVSDAQELLGAIFPKVEALFNHSAATSEWGKAEWRTAGRACADFATFSRYFVFAVDEDDLSTYDKDSFWESAIGVERLKQYLKKQSPKKLFSIYQYLTDIDLSQVGETSLRNIIDATIDIGDGFGKSSGFDDMFHGPTTQAMRALIVLLRALAPDERFALAMEALAKPPTSLQVPSEVAFVLTGEKYGLFSESQSADLKNACRDLFRSAWTNGTFQKHSRFLAMFPDWLGRESTERDAEAISLVRSTLSENDERFMELVALYEKKRFTGYEPDRFYTRYLTQIYSLPELEERLEKIERKPNVGAEEQRINELLEEIRRQMAIEGNNEEGAAASASLQVNGTEADE